jgi:predicted amidohydrolase
MSSVLIVGGRVIDPAAGVDGVMDVAVADGMVAAVGRGLDRGRADRVSARRVLKSPSAVAEWLAFRVDELRRADGDA